jgi:phage tail-like protein
MSRNTRPIQFRDYLPEVFQTDEVEGVSFLSKFLQAFEALFEELEGEIEGMPARTSGGVPDLFDPDVTPPPQFRHHPQPDSDYLNYLASWIALPLRADKPSDFHRAFFHAAIPLYPQRSTLVGMEKLLRAWLKGDLLEPGTDPPLLIVTDLTRTYNDVETIFQLAPQEPRGRAPGEVYAQLGVNTVLGEGPPFFFIVDLITNPALRELRHPAGLDVFQRAARLLLDAEKPAYTYYQLRVRAHTMQLAPEGVVEERYAQVGETTLLWDEPWVFDSEG